MKKRLLVGVSILEVVIAITILAVSALGIIQIFRKEGVRGEAFSAEHFTAMFLSQKILEDINNRIREDPYFFSQLVASASGELKSVVDGQSFYFRLLENTQNLDFLSEGDDLPITKDAGSFYNQLKNFKCQVACEFVPMPSSSQSYDNLINVIVSIFWKDAGGIDQKYVVSQMMYGLDTTAAISSTNAPVLTEKDAGWGLWHWLASDTAPNPPTLQSFMTYNGGGDPQVLKALGHALFVVIMTQGTTSVYNQYIEETEKLRDALKGSSDPKSKAKATLYQERVAQLYEQKATIIFSLVVRLLPSMPTLLNNPLNASTLGTKVFSAVSSLRGNIFGGMMVIDQISMNFAGAEDAYLKILQSPYEGDLAKRKINPTIRRLLDIEKIGVLLQDGFGNGEPVLAKVKSRITELEDDFSGHQPLFLEYLANEKNICGSLSSLKKTFGGDAGLAGLIKKVVATKMDYFIIESKLR